MTFKSAYLKLTLWYLAIVMLISAFFSVGLYTLAMREFSQDTELRRLSGRTSGPAVNWHQRVLTGGPERFQRGVRRGLVQFNLLILGVAGVASYSLARRTLRPIEEMLDRQSRFTADASHELRTPLTAMKAEIEVALRDSRLGLLEAKSVLNSNLEELDRLESLSNNLLKLAQYRAGAAPQKAFMKHSLKDIVEDAYNRIEPVADQRDIALEFDLDENLRQVPKAVGGSLAVVGDKQSLVELMVILLDNAIKYSAGGGTVSVATDSHRQHAEITVKDQGIGIKASDLLHIFDRFFRADRSRSAQSTNGYGLGLAIAKEIVEMHRGTIEAASTPNQGTVFTVKLPLAR